MTQLAQRTPLLPLFPPSNIAPNRNTAAAGLRLRMAHQLRPTCTVDQACLYGPPIARSMRACRQAATVRKTQHVVHLDTIWSSDCITISPDECAEHCNAQFCEISGYNWEAPVCCGTPSPENQSTDASLSKITRVMSRARTMTCVSPQSETKTSSTEFDLERLLVSGCRSR